MTDRFGLGNSEWVGFYNDSGETIPPFACIRLKTGIKYPSQNGSGYFYADKPNAFGAQYRHAFNGAMSVAAGKYGICTQVANALAAYDPADGTPAGGEMWGPRDATWLLKKNTGGFMVIGIPDSTRTNVLASPVPMLSIWGKAKTDIDKGDTGDIDIWVGAAGIEVDSTVDLTDIYNRWGDIANGDWCRADWSWMTGGWEFGMAECS